MRKRILIGIWVACVLVFSSSFRAEPVSALTIDDIRIQIKELLAKIVELTKQQNVSQEEGAPTTQIVTSTGVVDPSESSPNHRICSALYRNLSRGAQGDDVASLQEFLRDKGYLSANATGYFGPLTAQAVAKWQVTENISAVGSFGPLSRERIKVWCGGTGALQASPTLGPAPLSVYFWHVIGNSASDGYSIDFGDGAVSQLEIGCGTPPNSMIGACPRALVVSHTYTANGVYTATLTHMQDLCSGNPQCMAPVQMRIVGTVSIRVGGVACTMEYAPVCGQPPEPACRHSIPACMMPTPGPQTYGNRCMMNAAGAVFLYEGKCSAYPTACPADAMLCPDGSYVGRSGPNCQFVCPES